jgi:hypothetical protein
MRPDPFEQFGAEIDAKIDADLAALQRAWLQSNNDGYLFDALGLCHDRRLPAWLFTALNGLLIARVPKGEWRDRRRWQKVREGRERGLTWDDAYAFASERLAGSDAQGTPRTMRWSYSKLQRKNRR